MNDGDALRRFKAGVFHTLSHPTRIHIVECLSGGEHPVSALLEKVGVEPANLSQHLTVLKSRRLVIGRREGSQMFYRLANPLLSEVLASMRKYFLADLEQSTGLLRQMESHEA